MPERLQEDDKELLEELGVDVSPESDEEATPLEQRIVAGFEEILSFVDTHGRVPQHGENRDIFERLYAVRLDRIRASKQYCELLKHLDTRGILNEGACVKREDGNVSETDDRDLLAALGVDPSAKNEMTRLVHVRPREEINAAEEIAQRNPCKDFKKFKPIFATVQQELKAGLRRTKKYQDNADIKKGDLFILDGQKITIAELGEEFQTDFGRRDRRLRVIYDNGSESNLLLRSLQRALNKDKASRRITNPDLGPLFSNLQNEDDLTTGYIYVLKSKSEHPFISKNRDVIHKIGVTSSDVKSRIANAKKDPTYLLADVEVVATFKLANIDPIGVEALLQKFFSKARLDLALKDRFGQDVGPREWFLVPFDVIEQAITKLTEGTIGDFQYDPKKARIVPV